MSRHGPRDLAVAAWWRATLQARPFLGLLTRWSAPITWAGAGLVPNGCADVMAQTEPESAVTALDQQRQDGWDVGSQDRRLVFPGAQVVDAFGNVGWRDVMSTLGPRLAPRTPRWAPYYNPTLFQSLEAPRNADLRAAIRPIFTPEMSAASERGEALLSLLVENGVCRNDVALVLDLPGPEAVAVAAALAPCLDPVFVFANWPHPLGVVPAHLTLGAALYYLPEFERRRPVRPGEAAPVFVLDRLRLSPYIDAAGAFDNRYIAGLPSSEVLRAAGIEHVLYVTPNDQVTFESDDLNDDLVAIDRAGIDVQVLALSDFSDTPLPGWPDVPSIGPTPPVVGTGPRYYFGGSPGLHGCFWRWYGWRTQTPRTTALPSISAPPHLAPRCHFHPSPRATFFSAPLVRAAGGGGLRPHGLFLGQTSFGRSGSLGRAHFGTSG